MAASTLYQVVGYMLGCGSRKRYGSFLREFTA